MKGKLRSEGGRQTTLEQFLKPLNPYHVPRQSDEFSDEEAVSSNSSISDPSYEPNLMHSFRVRPRAHYKSLRFRKSSADALFFKKVVSSDNTEVIADEKPAVASTRYSDGKKDLGGSNGTAAANANTLSDVLPLVANSPPSDAEASLPITGSTPETSTKHDSDACTSFSFEKGDHDISQSESNSPGKGCDMHCEKVPNSRKNDYQTARAAARFAWMRKSRKKRVSRRAHKTEVLTLPQVHTVTIGAHVLEPLYISPLPLELVKKGHVYVCEKCLDFKESKETLERHMSKCWLDFPPGNEIFRQDEVSVFEVDGNISKVYSQNLCLLAKLFIDHKTLFYDVEPFLFYVLIVSDSVGCHLAGYFSKVLDRFIFQQKCGSENNLSCLLTLPSYQCKGYGRFLIDFSFLLSRREGMTGTPERPLSDMGNVAYRSYWQSALLEFFKRPSTSYTVLTLEDIANTTGILLQDIIRTMEELEMLQCSDDGEVKSFIVNMDLVEAHWAKAEGDARRIWIDEDNLQWEPKKYTIGDWNGLSGERNDTQNSD